MGVIDLQGSCPRDYCPRGSCPRDSCPKGSCPRGSCPSTIYHTPEVRRGDYLRLEVYLLQCFPLVNK